MCPVFSLGIFEYFPAFWKRYGVCDIDGTLSVYPFYRSTIVTTKIQGRYVIVAKEPELAATQL